MTPVPQAAAPEISGHDFIVTVELDPIAHTDEGVLMAMGDSFGGASVYVLDDRLEFALSALGDVTTVALDVGVHRGAKWVTATFRNGEQGGGEIRLACSAHPAAATAPVPWVPRLRFFMGTAQCGRDQSHPVTDRYTGPFPFRGRIERAIVDIHPRGGQSNRAEAIYPALMEE